MEPSYFAAWNNQLVPQTHFLFKFPNSDSRGMYREEKAKENARGHHKEKDKSQQQEKA